MASQNNSFERFGKLLTHPNPGEEVVITGLAGRYPNSKTVSKFQDNLFSKQDMLTEDNRRWLPGHPEIPHRTGKVDDIEKFDAGFFGIHDRQGHSLDPIARMFMETVIQAIFDAGLHPTDLEGTKTGVFVGACFSESEKFWFYERVEPQTFAMTGVERSMIANRISYFLKLKGPSVICDTACSSSLYALDHAYIAIRTGKCDAAIVGGANLCLHPNASLQFARLGVLSIDGSCKAFDNAGNGYARSETISALILQKSRDAKRIYATVLHSKINCDGYKDSGINYPSREMQVKLFKDFYDECDAINRSELSFLEAHGTGTKVGDPEELLAIEKVFLDGRQCPLLIGSIKSNIGHTEPSSGICSITKAIIAYESGYIAPNLHYNTPKEGIKCLVDGRAKVVTQKTLLKDGKGLIGINSFGFGGANGHVLLKHNPKKKSSTSNTTIPKLITVSGRTPEAVNILLDNVIENKLDVEQIRLLQNAFRKTVNTHNYRGYSLLTKTNEMSRSCSYFNFKPVSLIICFGIIESVSKEKIKEFMEVPTFSRTIKK